MLRAFSHVVLCCDMLQPVGYCWIKREKKVKFSMQHLWKLRDAVVVWPGSCNNFVPGHAH